MVRTIRVSELDVRHLPRLAKYVLHSLLSVDDLKLQLMANAMGTHTLFVFRPTQISKSSVLLTLGTSVSLGNCVNAERTFVLTSLKVMSCGHENSIVVFAFRCVILES